MIESIKFSGQQNNYNMECSPKLDISSSSLSNRQSIDADYSKSAYAYGLAHVKSTQKPSVYRKEYNINLPDSTCYKLTKNTTPNELQRLFDKYDIRYLIDYSGEKNNNRSVSLLFLDNNGKLIRGYGWYYGQNTFEQNAQMISITEFNQKGEEIKVTNIRNDK